MEDQKEAFDGDTEAPLCGDRCDALPGADNDGANALTLS